MADVFYPFAFVLAAGLAICAGQSWLSLLGLSLYFILLGLVSGQIFGWPTGFLHWATGEAAALILFVPMVSRTGSLRLRWAPLQEPTVLGRWFTVVVLVLAASTIWVSLSLSPWGTAASVPPWLTFGAFWSVVAGAVTLLLHRGPLKAGLGVLLTIAGGTLLAIPADVEAMLVILISSALVSILAALSASYLSVHLREATLGLTTAETIEQEERRP